MKKPVHDYYEIPELIQKWEKYSITETDILKWGASGQLEFSAWITPGDKFDYINLWFEYIEEEKISDEQRRKGHPGWYSVPFEEPIKIYKGERRLYSISNRTVDYFLNHQTGDRVKPTVIPFCENCSIYKESKKKCNHGCSVYFEGILHGNDCPDTESIFITKNDLVVTHEELIRFEKELPLQNEIVPRYLDPEDELYSVTLDLAVRAWQAVFIDKKNLDKKSAKKAAQKYLMSTESGCPKLLEDLKDKFMEMKPSRAEDIAKIATGQYSTNKRKWNQFRNNK